MLYWNIEYLNDTTGLSSDPRCLAISQAPVLFW